MAACKQFNAILHLCYPSSLQGRWKEFSWKGFYGSCFLLSSFCLLFRGPSNLCHIAWFHALHQIIDCWINHRWLYLPYSYAKAKQVTLFSLLYRTKHNSYQKACEINLCEVKLATLVQVWLKLSGTLNYCILENSRFIWDIWVKKMADWYIFESMETTLRLELWLGGEPSPQSFSDKEKPKRLPDAQVKSRS